MWPCSLFLLCVLLEPLYFYVDMSDSIDWDGNLMDLAKVVEGAVALRLHLTEWGKKGL